jgi:hypothetical protein
MLPARQGDCLWITYGSPHEPHHLVIDGGPERSGTLLSFIDTKLRAARGHKLHIDLLVVSHVDNDHIGGVLELIEWPPEGLTFGDIWFNAYRHLLPADLLGPDQGDRLSKELDKRKLPWNLAFDGGPVTIPTKGTLPRFERAGGLALTLLGPTADDLARLERKWKAVVEEGREKDTGPEDLLGRHDPWPPDIRALAGQAFQPDKGKANGSSIALFLEYEGKRVVCAADAFAGRISSSLLRLPIEEDPLRLDALKLSHHGSRKSTSSELLKRIACKRYLISTNGSYFGHPDAEAMARVLVHGGAKPELIFNYSSKYSSRWADGSVTGAPAFWTRFPGAGAEGMEIEL